MTNAGRRTTTALTMITTGLLPIKIIMITYLECVKPSTDAERSIHVRFVITSSSLRGAQVYQRHQHLATPRWVQLLHARGHACTPVF